VGLGSASRRRARQRGIRRAQTRRTLVRRCSRSAHEREAEVIVNGPGAALVAAASLVTVVPESDFYVESVQEFAALAGHSPTEPNPVGAEPWLIVIVDLTCRRRWIYVVAADGRVAAQTSVAIDEFELTYMRRPG
jgi:hypothetical protein